MAYKILFGKKYFNHEITTVPSGFLVWCIESYDNADWMLINECKKELSARLKLDWTEPEPEVPILRRKLKAAESRIEHLENVIVISTMCGGNWMRVEAMINSPELVNEFLNLNK